MKKILPKIIILIVIILISSTMTSAIIYFYYHKNISNTSKTPEEQPQYIYVPFAKEELLNNYKISADMIGLKEVPITEINAKKDLITTDKTLLNSTYCVKSDIIIPKGSYFFKNSIIPCDNKIAKINIPNNYISFDLSKGKNIIFDKSIKPGDEIDIFIKINNTNEELLVESIPVFVANENYLILAVPNYNNFFTSISALEYFEDITITVKKSTSIIHEVKITNQYLWDLIISRTNAIPPDIIDE